MMLVEQANLSSATLDEKLNKILTCLINQSFKFSRRANTLDGSCSPNKPNYKVNNLIMTQATATKPAAAGKTCSTCPNFNDHLYSESKGWCELFNLPARSFHEQTNHCILNSETTAADPESFLEDIFANYSPEELEALSEAAFPTEVVELDRDGYPMSEDTVANAYFDPNFVSLPNEPF